MSIEQDDDELPRLTKGWFENAMYIDPDGPCKLISWIDYDVICWLQGLDGDFHDNVNEILKEKMQKTKK